MVYDRASIRYVTEEFLFHQYLRRIEIPYRCPHLDTQSYLSPLEKNATSWIFPNIHPIPILLLQIEYFDTQLKQIFLFGRPMIFEWYYEHFPIEGICDRLRPVPRKYKLIYINLWEEPP